MANAGQGLDISSYLFWNTLVVAAEDQGRRDGAPEDTFWLLRGLSGLPQLDELVGETRRAEGAWDEYPGTGMESALDSMAASQ
ncbi:hypothetical protein HDU93_009813, partial [Gonapodya sp. JEL0774]